ncbi:MAG: antitoxin [Candidatus Omnitrophica bacterium]|nr:antitoxin [Candidatus Omnitrophota bacterium]
MKKVKLNKEEQEIMKSIENDEFVPVKGKAFQDVADAIAARKKDSTLTLRVNSRDVVKIKKMAQKKGIPYQSYIAEVIHRVAEAV